MNVTVPPISTTAIAYPDVDRDRTVLVSPIVTTISVPKTPEVDDPSDVYGD